MLGVQDLALTSTERTLSNFREEAAATIGQIAGDRAQVIDDFDVSEKLREVPRWSRHHRSWTTFGCRFLWHVGRARDGSLAVSRIPRARMFSAQ